MIKGKFRLSDDGMYIFYCPGCNQYHYFRVNKEKGGPCWDFNFDYYKPTVTPSVLITGKKRCHSFIKDGQIQYLSDCEHHLAGQTIEMINYQESEDL